ncbi:MAG: ATP-binding cassette domain-containing protein [Candidatus Peribacteraceae bacterium]
MIVLKNVSKAFGSKKVLTQVSFQVNPKEFVCITGPSGAGKSTLIHLLAGAEQASSGSIEVDGVDLRAIPPMALRLFRRRVGIVFQDYKLLPHFTVRENVAFPLEVCGEADAAIARRVDELLKEMHLKKIANALPEEISGGEQARTAIARAIVHKPMVLLADEPTGNLDPDQSEQVLKIFRSIHRAGTTVVLATHDTALVDILHTRVIRLEDGKITRDSAGGYHTPKSAAHQILQETSEESPKNVPKKRSSKNVRITAISS